MSDFGQKIPDFGKKTGTCLGGHSCPPDESRPLFPTNLAAAIAAVTVRMSENGVPRLGSGFGPGVIAGPLATPEAGCAGLPTRGPGGRVSHTARLAKCNNLCLIF